MAMRFLSPEWAEAFKAALNADPSFREGIAGQRVRLQNVITDVDGGEVRYWLRIEDGEVDLGFGDIESPDATITQSYATAAALARGELGQVAAFMSGKLKVSGDLIALMGLAGPFAALPEIMASLDVEY
jgi:putative sterol carrier protein